MIQKRLVLITTVCAAIGLLTALLAAACKNSSDSGKTAVAGVRLDRDTLSLSIGGTETLTATVQPEKAADVTVLWSSNPPGIVTVIRGKVTAIAAGTATVTVTTADGGFTAKCTVTVTAAGNPVDPNNPKPPLYWHPDLLWQDEFDGDTLDLAKWNIDWGHGDQYGVGGWGNGEFQFYHPDNVSVKNGKLILEARKEARCPCGAVHTASYMDNTVHKTYGAYTSGKITTAGVRNLGGVTPPAEPQKFAVPPGFRVEASIKVPRGRAFWPAFWMLGENVSEWSSAIRPWVEWPRCGEIDIMETNALNHHKYGVCLHGGKAYGTNDPNDPTYPNGGYWLRGGDYEHEASLADDFYVYGVKWDSEELTFYLQDADQEVQYFSWTLNFAAQEETEFNNMGVYSAYTDAFSQGRFSIILNLAISGAYVAGEYNPYTDELVDDWTYPTTWAVPPKDSAFGDTPELYRDRTLQVDWVRVHRWVKETN